MLEKFKREWQDTSHTYMYIKKNKVSKNILPETSESSHECPPPPPPQATLSMSTRSIREDTKSGVGGGVKTVKPPEPLSN